MISMQVATIKSVMSGLAEIDDGANSILDINSLMNAMEDYIQRCVSGGDNVGVPINFFLKPITKSMIIRAWLAKYFPNKYNIDGSIDDKQRPGSGSGSDTTKPE